MVGGGRRELGGGGKIHKAVSNQCFREVVRALCVCAVAGWVADQSFEHALITMFFTGGKLSAQNLVYLVLYRCERYATCCFKKQRIALILWTFSGVILCVSCCETEGLFCKHTLIMLLFAGIKWPTPDAARCSLSPVNPPCSFCYTQV